MPVADGRYVKKRVGESKEVVRSKFLHRALKSLAKEARNVRGFLCQKKVREIAKLRQQGMTEDAAELQASLQALAETKAVDHVAVGKAAAVLVGGDTTKEAEKQGDVFKKLLGHKRMQDAIKQWSVDLEETLTTKKVRARERVGHTRPPQEEQQASKRPKRDSVERDDAGGSAGWERQTRSDDSANLFIGSLRDAHEAEVAAKGKMAEARKKRSAQQRQKNQEQRERDRCDPRGQSNFARDMLIYGPGDGTDVSHNRKGRPPTPGYVRDDKGTADTEEVEGVGEKGVAPVEGHGSGSLGTRGHQEVRRERGRRGGEEREQTDAAPPRDRSQRQNQIQSQQSQQSQHKPTTKPKPKPKPSGSADVTIQHPSWVAKQKLKEQNKNAFAAASGTRMSFDDSDSD